MHDTIEPYVNRKIIVLHEGESIAHVARAMRDNGVGLVVLADHQGHITGVVTDRDIVTRAISESCLPQTPVSRVMSRELASETVASRLDGIIQMMKQYGVRRVPILKKGKKGTKCVGLVSLDDLVVARAVSIDDVSAIVRAQIRRRARAARPPTTSSALEQKIVQEIASRVSISNERALMALQYLISVLIRRLHYTAAYSLISALPLEMQVDMSDVSPGPDRRIDREYLLQGLAARLKTTEDRAAAIAQDIWSTLKNSLGLERLRHVFDQLPKDIKETIAPGEEASRGKQLEEWELMDAPMA